MGAVRDMRQGDSYFSSSAGDTSPLNAELGGVVLSVHLLCELMYKGIWLGPAAHTQVPPFLEL